MLYMVTAERIPGDERSRERLFIEAANAGEAWARAGDECKRLGVMSVIVDVRLRPSRTGAKAPGNSSFASSERIGQRTGLNVLQSAVGALFLAILPMTGCLALAPAHAQQTTSVSDDVQKGHYLAVLMCSNCHVVSPGQSIEPTLQPPAPSFESIAQRSTTSSETLGAFLATTHRHIGNSAGMPNPELLDFQMGQVKAYVLSLRNSNAAAAGRNPPATRPELCRGEIARVELLISKARAGGKAVGSAPESSAARLHRQPDVKSVRQAKDEAEKNVETALAFARELEAEGLDAECTATLQKIEPSSGSRD